MGFSGQNPYVRSNGGSNPWVEKFQRDQKAERARAKLREEKMDNSKEVRAGKLVDIDDVITKSEEIEERKRVEHEVKEDV